MVVDNLNIEKLTESFFQEKFIFAQIWAKKAQNDPKKRFWIFWKIFVMLVFPGNNLKSKLIYLVIDILPTHLAKFWVSSYGSKCCQPIKLQDSLKCNIVRKKWIMKFIFLHADKCWSLQQGDTIILGECNQACPKYPK